MPPINGRFNLRAIDSNNVDFLQPLSPTKKCNLFAQFNIFANRIANILKENGFFLVFIENDFKKGIVFEIIMKFADKNDKYPYHHKFKILFHTIVYPLISHQIHFGLLIYDNEICWFQYQVYQRKAKAIEVHTARISGACRLGTSFFAGMRAGKRICTFG